MVRADRGDVERCERCGRLLGGHAAERLRVLVEGQQRDDRQRRDGADGADRGEELVELVERLDHEEVDAAALEELRLLGEDGVAVLHRPAERADRAGDEDVRAGHLARVARDLHGGLVDRRDVVLEVVLGELAPVRAEGVRLDDVRAGADEAEVQRERRSRARGCSPPRGSAGAERRSRRASPCRRRRRAAGRPRGVRGTGSPAHSTIPVAAGAPCERGQVAAVNALRGSGQAPPGDARGGGIDESAVTHDGQRCGGRPREITEG